MARYSAMYRPACRMNQTGVWGAGCRLSAARNASPDKEVRSLDLDLVGLERNLGRAAGRLPGLEVERPAVPGACENARGRVHESFRQRRTTVGAPVGAGVVGPANVEQRDCIGAQIDALARARRNLRRLR